jgi:hypothetical protein
MEYSQKNLPPPFNGGGLLRVFAGKLTYGLREVYSLEKE